MNAVTQMHVVTLKEQSMFVSHFLDINNSLIPHY